jgi:hypothetical protein
MKKKYFFLLILIVVGISFLIIFDKPKYENPPCYYFVNEGEVKMYGIENSEIDFYKNKDGIFFFLEKETNKEIPECIK